MDLLQAAERARRAVRVVGGPVIVLDHRSGAVERTWCFVFVANTVEFVATGDVLSGFLGVGPVIVPKDGSPVILLGSVQMVVDYERVHGIDGGQVAVHDLDPEPEVRHYRAGPPEPGSSPASGR